MAALKTGKFRNWLSIDVWTLDPFGFQSHLSSTILFDHTGIQYGRRMPLRVRDKNHSFMRFLRHPIMSLRILSNR